jgi:hypothetical protein
MTKANGNLGSVWDRHKMASNVSYFTPHPLHLLYNKGIQIPEALKSLYRSPGYKKNQLVLCKNYVLQW